MIYLGSDHGGFDLKEKIKKWLAEWNYQFEDMGNTVYDGDDDYPVYAFRVARKVAENAENRGILVCRSAAGMVIAANKVKGIRAATAFDAKSAGHQREHNDANVLAMSGDWLDEELAKDIIGVWLKTEKSSDLRHERRVKLIKEYEENNLK